MPYSIRILRAAALFAAFAPVAQAENLPTADPLRNMACAALGGGFHAIAGTDTCIRTGGSVRVDSGYASGGDFNTATSNARGTVKLETRTQTDFGLVRTYIEMNADLGPDE
jgi:hypothetical protein